MHSGRPRAVERYNSVVGSPNIVSIRSLSRLLDNSVTSTAAPEIASWGNLISATNLDARICRPRPANSSASHDMEPPSRSACSCSTRSCCCRRLCAPEIWNTYSIPAQERDKERWQAPKVHVKASKGISASSRRSHQVSGGRSCVHDRWWSWLH